MDSINTNIMSQQGWRFLWEHANVLVARLNREGTILAANDFAKKISALALVGQPLPALLVSFTDASQWQEWLTAPDRLHLGNIQTAEGIPKTYYFSILPIANEYLLCGQPDLVEQDHLQREFLALNHEMGNLSRELGIKNAELAHLNMLKNQFLGMATHDLRKPVGLILNYAEFLTEEIGPKLSPEQHHFLDTIIKAAEGMRHVIEEFLDISIIEAGRLSLNQQPTDLSAVVQSALTLATTAMTNRKIRVETELEPSTIKLFVDGPKLEQVITNLLSNAAEHSPDGGCVRIRSKKVTTGLDLRISDEGTGIPSGKREKLFHAFEGRNELKPSGERSIGLGLTIAQKIIEAHGGQMVVESDSGHGAVIGFTLPLGCFAATSH